MILLTLESRRNSPVRLPQGYSLVSTCRLACCKPQCKAGFFQLLVLVSIIFTSGAPPATGPHFCSSADSCSACLRLSPSCSVSNLSAPNSGFSILLSVCDILIHCPHFLCYSFIFISISDKNITYSLSQFLHLVLCLFHTIVCIAFLPNYIKSSSELGCSFNTN